MLSTMNTLVYPILMMLKVSDFHECHPLEWKTNIDISSTRMTADMIQCQLSHIKQEQKESQQKPKLPIVKKLASPNHY